MWQGMMTCDDVKLMVWRCDDGRYGNAIDYTMGCCDGSLAVQWETTRRTRWSVCRWWKWKQVEFNPPCCTWLDSWLPCNRMRLQAIASDLKKNLSFTTVRVLENASGTKSGTESLPKVFLHANCEQISFIIFFAFLKMEEMGSGTHFTQQNMFLLFTVVVTKHVWPYFQSCFPKTSSERVSSSPCPQNRREKGRYDYITSTSERRNW